MKKSLIFIVLLVFVALFVVGCGNQQAEEAAAVAEEEAAVVEEEAPAAAEEAAAPAEAEEEAAEEAPAAAEEAAPAEAEELTIGALWLDASEFYTMVEAGIQEAAANSDMDITILGSNSQGDSAIEADQMQTLIGANVDAIIMSAVSEDASVEFVKQANEAGIPVICYNSCLTEEDAEKYVYTWVTGDQTQQGTMVGTALGEYFVEQGMEEPKVGVINCERYAVCQQRIAGFTAALTELVPGAVIVDNQEALEVDKAVEVATNMLTANPDIDAFYGEAGNMCAGATVAIQQADLVGDVVVFGHDISPNTADLLMDGTVLKHINAMIGEEFGSTSLDFALSAIAGEPSPGVIYNMTPAEFWADQPDAVQAWIDAH